MLLNKQEGPLLQPGQPDENLNVVFIYKFFCDHFGIKSVNIFKVLQSEERDLFSNMLRDENFLGLFEVLYDISKLQGKNFPFQSLVAKWRSSYNQSSFLLHLYYYEDYYDILFSKNANKKALMSSI